MKAILTIDEVRKALNAFVAEGKKPTLAVLHAALGNRGSMSTLVRLKAEIEGAASAANDSPEGLRIFREVWALAVNEGRRQQELVTTELRDNLKALAAENERLEGACLAAESHAGELEQMAFRAQAELASFRLHAEKQVEEAKAAFAAASIQAANALEKLAEAQAAHACQMAAMQAERTTAVENVHGLELRLARTQALLEASGFSDKGSGPKNAGKH